MAPTKNTLEEISRQLQAFLSIPDGPDALPALSYVDVGHRPWHGGAWSVQAFTGPHFDARSAADAIAAVRAYAAAEGSKVSMDDPYRSDSQPSGWTVRVAAKVVLGGIPVEVCALLDGDEYAAAIAAETQTAQVSA